MPSFTTGGRRSGKTEALRRIAAAEPKPKAVYRKGLDGVFRDINTGEPLIARKRNADIETPVQREIIDAMEAAVDEIDVRAVPNSAGKIGKRAQAKLKLAGVKAGTLDLLIAWPRTETTSGMGVMEIKPPGYAPSKVSTEQRELIARWGKWGLNVGIASTKAEALALLRQWGVDVRAVRA